MSYAIGDKVFVEDIDQIGSIIGMYDDGYYTIRFENFPYDNVVRRHLDSNILDVYYAFLYSPDELGVKEGVIR